MLDEELKQAIITSIGQNPQTYGGDSALTAHTALAQSLCSWCTTHVKANVSGTIGTTPMADVCSINFNGTIAVPSTFADFTASIFTILSTAVLTNGTTLVVQPTVAFTPLDFSIPQTFSTFDEAWSTIGGYIETWMTTHPSLLPFTASVGAMNGTFNIVNIMII